jgi:TetR/AcrR family transcriptional regulator, transcriptional repressor of aconitase
LPKVSEEHRHSRRRQILAAAVECFARQGFQRTTMEDIIREAELSAGAIYSYFQSKEQIITKLADERHEREERIIAEGLKRGDTTASLRELFASFYESLTEPEVRKERRMGVHLWAEALCNPKVLPWIQRGINQPLKLISTAIANAQRRGELRTAINPDAVGRVLIALFHGLILQQAWDDKTDIVEFTKTARAMAMQYLAPAGPNRSGKVRALHPR